MRDARDPALPVPAGRIAAAVSAFDAARGNPGHERNTNGEKHAGPELPTSSRPGVLPSGALLTTEPGGQLELSSQPADSLGDLVRATSADLVALRAELAARGLELAGIGLDPLRPPRRVLTLPRYAAMEAFFDQGGPWGRQMMCATASVQVCLDAGDDSDGPVRLPAAVAAAARDRAGARGRLRELAAARREADRVGVVPAAGLDADGPRPDQAAAAERRPARRLGRVRARRAGDVRAQPGFRGLVSPARADVPRLGARRSGARTRRHGTSAAGTGHRGTGQCRGGDGDGRCGGPPPTTSSTTCPRCSRRSGRAGTSSCG